MTGSGGEGGFELRFYHKIFEGELGKFRGHIGPINSIAISSNGRMYVTGGEDGHVRLLHMDAAYINFKVHPQEP